MKTIYVVKRETNDKGWHSGDQLFESAEEAVKHLRDYAAQLIMWLRKEGYTVDLLHCWKDSVIGAEAREPSQTVTFRTFKKGEGYGYYDFRVFASYLWESNDEYRKGRWPWNL